MNRYSLGDYEAFEGKDASKPIYFFITSPYMGIAPPTPIYFIMAPFFDCLPSVCPTNFPSMSPTGMEKM